MIYGENYVLQRADHILLYGAATTGAILYTNLTKSGFHVQGFIDQRADEINSYYGLPVWDAVSAGGCEKNRNSVVIIAIKNVFEHERVAGTLWRAGFRRVIFRPGGSVCGEETEPERLLNMVYDRVMNKGGIGELPPCPEIKGIAHKTLKDHAIVLDQGDYVTANIPAPYVFTDKYEDRDIMWGDIPCLGLLPHLGLFDMFNGNWNSDYAEYMKYCRQAAEKSGGIVTSGAWEASVYQNRLDVFNHMQYSWEHDRSFFIKNAVEGIYNPKGYFNIRSGKHRIAYMLTKGSRYIPLRIKRVSYELWSGKDRAERIAGFLWENGMEALPVVLMNPYFYDYTSSTSVFYEKILTSLVTMICRDSVRAGKPIRFQGKSVLFCGTPMALYAQVFRILGFDVYILEHDPMNRKLNETVLSGMAVHFLEEAEGGPEAYDVAILEKMECSLKIHAHMKATICGEPQKGRGQPLCGASGNGLLYAYLELDGSRSKRR